MKWALVITTYTMFEPDDDSAHRVIDSVRLFKSRKNAELFNRALLAANEERRLGINYFNEIIEVENQEVYL